MPRAKLRTEELQDRILAATIELLASEGIGRVTTRRVAAAANTSAPALYELFGDRAGLVREVFYEGFRRLAAELGTLTETEDPRADLLTLLELQRQFSVENQALSDVMFARPFSDFDPTADGLAASLKVRNAVMSQVVRAIQAGVISGDAKDIALVLTSVAGGLSAAENAQRLGSGPESVQRRWDLALNAVLDGLAR